MTSFFVPRDDESFVRGADRPIAFNPYSDIQRAVDDERALIEREIEQLRAILSKPRRRHDD